MKEIDTFEQFIIAKVMGFDYINRFTKYIVNPMRINLKIN